MSVLVDKCFPYLELLQAANQGLAAVKHFDFFPGMLFESREKWWPDVGMRPAGHEGIDICFYTDGGGDQRRLDEETRVPVMAGGSVYTICGDYLGQSVFIDHGCSGSLRRLSVYAHIDPFPHIHVGRELAAGEVMGSLAATTGRKNRMPAHVHLSLMDVPCTLSSLDWKYICNAKDITLIDPLLLLCTASLRIFNRNPWKEKMLQIR